MSTPGICVDLFFFVSVSSGLTTLRLCFPAFLVREPMQDEARVHHLRKQCQAPSPESSVPEAKPEGTNHIPEHVMCCFSFQREHGTWPHHIWIPIPAAWPENRTRTCPCFVCFFPLLLFRRALDSGTSSGAAFFFFGDSEECPNPWRMSTRLGFFLDKRGVLNLKATKKVCQHAFPH